MIKSPVAQMFKPLFDLDAKNYSNDLRKMSDDQISVELMVRQKKFSSSLSNGDDVERAENEAMFNCVVQEIMRRGSPGKMGEMVEVSYEGESLQSSI